MARSLGIHSQITTASCAAPADLDKIFATVRRIQMAAPKRKLTIVVASADAGACALLLARSGIGFKMDFK